MLIGTACGLGFKRFLLKCAVMHGQCHYFLSIQPGILLVIFVVARLLTSVLCLAYEALIYVLSLKIYFRTFVCMRMF